MIKPLLIFDLETTSADIAIARIVEFAALKVYENGDKERFQTLINPGIPITNSDIHGITDEMVKDQPKFSDVADKIRDFMDNCDLSGYNCLRFDIPLLAEEFARVRIPWGLSGRKVVDPFLIYKILYSQSLSAAYKHYTGKEIDGAHRAMADVEASFDVLMGIIREGRNGDGKLQLDTDLTATQVMDELVKFQRNGEEYDPMVDFAGKFLRRKDGVIILNFGKHKGEPVQDHLDFIEWMIGKDFTSNTLQWAESFLNDGQLF